MIKQFVPQKICLVCQGCCRFLEQQSVWQPNLSDEEIKKLPKKYLSSLTKDKKISLVKASDSEVFYCAFFDSPDNQCKIYKHHPFECQLYPFLINRQDGKILIAVDLNCHFAAQNLDNAKFRGYLKYLASILQKKSFLNTLIKNPHLLQHYPNAINLMELRLCSGKCSCSK